jgi:PilZ domain
MKENQARPVVTAETQNPPVTQKSRRGGRISKQVPILLIGHDSDGRVFTEETHTLVLSMHGAGIVSRQRLVAEQELVLRWREKEREADVRVVGEIAQQGDLHTYGVAFVKTKVDFWQMEFPEADLAERPAVLLLECTGCRDAVELLNGDFEYDVCAIHGGLTRYCEDCGLLTVWRQSSEAMPVTRRVKTVKSRPKAEGPGAVEAAAAKKSDAKRLEDPVVATTESDTSKDVERRARVRAKVNFFACVRSEKFEDDIVTCIDMARGGVSFRSRNCYELGAAISISVPFAAEERQAPAIFVNGRITNVKKLANGEMYRCGLEFVKG